MPNRVEFADVLLIFLLLSAALFALRWSWFRGKPHHYQAAITLLWAYLPLLLLLTFFPLWFYSPLTLRPLRPLLSVALPFQDLANMLATPGILHYPLIVVRNVAGNLFLLLPVGFLLPLLRPMSWRRTFAAGLLIGLALEGLQLALAVVGGTVRVISSDDALLNAAGALLGFGAFRLVAGLWRAMPAAYDTLPRERRRPEGTNVY